MTLKHLEVFIEVCREKSFTKAGEKLNMAQPTISRMISELESYYGTHLFERMNRTIYITQAGTTLYQYSDAIISQYYEAKNVMDDVDHTAQIRIGSNITCAHTLLDNFLIGFQKKNPEIPLSIKVSNSQDIEQAILSNELDFGFIDSPLKPELLYSQKIAEDSLALMCSVNYDLDKPIDFEHLKNIPLLVREQGSSSREVIEQLFQQKCAAPNIVMESSDVYSLIKMCKTGFGVVMLTKNMLLPWSQDKNLKYIDINNLSLKRSYCFVHHKKKYLTKSMQKFKNYVFEKIEMV